MIRFVLHSQFLRFPARPMPHQESLSFWCIQQSFRKNKCSEDSSRTVKFLMLIFQPRYFFTEASLCGSPSISPASWGCSKSVLCSSGCIIFFAASRAKEHSWKRWITKFTKHWIINPLKMVHEIFTKIVATDVLVIPTVFERKSDIVWCA